MGLSEPRGKSALSKLIPALGRGWGGKGGRETPAEPHPCSRGLREAAPSPRGAASCTEHLNRLLKLAFPIGEFKEKKKIGAFSSGFAPTPENKPQPSPLPLGWDWGAVGAPGLSGGPTLDFHPLSHTDCTRTALLLHGHCSTRTTKDKTGPGSRSAPSWSHPPGLWGGQRGHPGSRACPGSPELILSLDVKETETERNKGKSYIDPSPTPPTKGPKQRAATKPKQKVQRKKEIAHSRVWSVGSGRGDGGASKQTGPGLSLSE